MEHIKNFKIFERDFFIEEDKLLQLINDMVLEVKDLGFDVTVKGYEGYSNSGKGNHLIYDIMIKDGRTFQIYDIGNKNISELSKMKNSITKLNEFSRVMDEIIKRLIDNNLYLFSWEINTMGDNGDFYSFVRLAINSDGSRIENYIYDNNDEW